jgi:hypothetical protein
VVKHHTTRIHTHLGKVQVQVRRQLLDTLLPELAHALSERCEAAAVRITSSLTHYAPLT